MEPVVHHAGRRVVAAAAGQTLAPVVAFALAGTSLPSSAADGSITGVVKAAGLSSNADAVVYVQDGNREKPGAMLGAAYTALR